MVSVLKVPRPVKFYFFYLFVEVIIREGIKPAANVKLIVAMCVCLLHA